MGEITADLVQSLLNITDENPPNTIMEHIIDLAVDCLNIFGADLPNMTGTAPSKTLNVESRQKGGILVVTRMIYYGFYKGITSAQIDGLNVSIPDIMSNPVMWNAIKEIARELKDFDISIG